MKRIKFHGCRHTADAVAAAGTPPHVVAARLGHSVMELMKTYPRLAWYAVRTPPHDSGRCCTVGC